MQEGEKVKEPGPRLVSLNTAVWEERLARSDAVLSPLGAEIKGVLRVISSVVQQNLSVPGSLYLVGSAAEGRLSYAFVRGVRVLASDLDLLLVLPNSVTGVESLHRNIKTLVEVARDTHFAGMEIGLRTRRVQEMHEFAFKYRTLGADFLGSAIVLFEKTEWVPPELLEAEFSVGHYAENLCSKLWTIVRYCRPMDWISPSERTRRKANTAVRYLEGARCFAGSWPEYEIENRGGVRVPVRDELEAIAAYAVERYGRDLSILTSKYPGKCVSIWSAGEFDFFNMSREDPAALAEAVLLLLEMGYARQLTGEGREKLEDVCKRLKLKEVPGLGASHWSEAYGWLRVAIGRERVARSPLFRRDRGPGFVDELVGDAAGAV